MNKNVLSVVGARPQFVKAGAVSRAFLATPGLTERIVHTGQHFDDNMSEVFFRELDIPKPAHNLGIGGGPQGQMTGRMLEAIEAILIDEKPDMVLVYGDTNSTLAGTLAAAKLHIPVAHVEAGLRSFNRRMPEEINRVMADHLSAMLFCPTSVSVANLASEGIVRNVHHVGDVMYDATVFARDQAQAASSILERLGLEDGAYGLCTVHRAESTDDPVLFAELIQYLERVAADNPIVFPVHPRTRKTLDALGITPKNLILMDPVGYFDIHRLLSGAALVLTDSGGLQKEAYFHGVPCVTLRTETEWVETISSGWNRLWRHEGYATPRTPIDEYGAGDAAQKIVTLIKQQLS
ncbi:UDP-N-acetylglucosamine 2-epimerase (non-hydrolyzing) [Devosia rhodophyticola]|uniref:UDP-N-acetylglucosamine 2-epimerase (Non-hydrolyzing) n=1 Tax=Devosia rhodophyticola TaxID=3026423 RepID=A0ABY7Z171_9HYPH|nr:UDP-N-acetylglucosamine 2-epimerase (non-hydrolyzing) [Devosia rhodophyticola]WDR07276.1 UDP-N-acetylglucosamine 2-epimerase (non-hydrolyzing) [Devosia rhodophyticola]